jgi:PAS domain S-box-containing protein
MTSLARSTWLNGSAWRLSATAGLAGLTGLAAFALVDGGYAPFLFWPPAGIALGAALLWGYRMALAAAAGVFVAAYWGGEIGLQSSLALALALALQALLGGFLLRRQDFQAGLDRVSDLFKLAFLGGLLAVLPALPLLHVALYTLEPLWGLSDVQFALFGVMGQLASTVILAALLLCLFSPRSPNIPSNGARWPELALVFGGLALVLMFLVRPAWFGMPNLLMRPYPVLPFLLWLGLRGNPQWTAVALLGVFVALSSNAGWGRIDAFLLAEGVRVLPLHGFMATIALVFLSLAIVTLQRNQSEQRLRLSEARYRGIVESSQSWFWAADAEGKFSYASPQVAAMLEAEPAALLGRELETVFDVDSARSFLTVGDTPRRHDVASMTREHVVTGAGGVTLHLETSCVPMRDEIGRLCGCQCITRNISDLSATRRALGEANIRFQQLVEHIHEVFWIARRDSSEFLYVSPACERMLGIQPETLYREPLAWLARVHPEDMEITKAGLAKQEQGESVAAEFRILHPERGIRWLSAQVFPFLDRDGEPLVAGILEDITERHQAEAKRLAYALAQRETLIREVHHRIKNNLQTVVSLLRRDAAKMPESRVAIEMAISQVQSVAVVHGLQGQIARESVMLCELLPAIVGMVSSLTGVAVQLTGVHAGGGHLHVKENETVAVALVLNELVTNAVKHRVEDSMTPPRIDLEIVGDSARIRIVNAGHLPAGFDFSMGRAIGIGLGLVRSLMSAEGMRLSYRQIGDEVETLVVLESPVLMYRTDEERQAE